YHDPVLLQACLEGLNIRPDGVYVDVTFGGGGHSKAILSRLGEFGRLIAFDRDHDAWKNAPDDARFTLIKSDFRWLKNHLRFQHALPIDGLLADLGVSSHQFDTGARGFSIRFDGPLDMRMDRRAKHTAAHVVNSYDEVRLAHVLGDFGEVHGAMRVAKTIIQARTAKRINTTFELMDALAPVTPKREESSFRAQVFQALRIEVNDELRSLEALLKQSAQVIKPGGKLVVMSYHSLEDRAVKNWMRAGDLSGVETKDLYGNRTRPFDPESNKAVMPDEEEIARNPRARSARLRTATKT
ncbi:MAG TPA: 16S rRNA (cytosine(1402)-N(4))-methyltransferase RsmH, partial [Flavobacteriales bacterium]|nr:16S rRNA (cytosine(1402)-N(4))-methyltransferase RsmH [Flavobacteriales bacterium]